MHCFGNLPANCNTVKLTYSKFRIPIDLVSKYLVIVVCTIDTGVIILSPIALRMAKTPFAGPGLQIRGGIEDNSKTIFLISQRKHVSTRWFK